MILEQDLVPYSTSELPSSPWLILAPHPDDESIGMGGTLCWAREQGIKVWLVVVTDGGKAGDPIVRKNELHQATKILGIERLICWDLPDRKVQGKKEIFKKNLFHVVSELKPATIFLPSYFEFHPDHRMTTQLALTYLKEYLYNSTIWLYEISRQGEVNKLIDITDFIEDKKKAICCYKSQLVQKNYLDMAISLNKVRAYTLPQHTQFVEGFWELKHNDCIELQKACTKYFNFNNFDNILVSIVVRTKNRPLLLRDALSSILNQTYKHIEVIIVNDGGEDVYSIIQDFQNAFYKLNYINKKISVGRAAAANIGLKAATGEWVSLLDDDDVLLSNAISVLLNYSKAANAIYGKVELVTRQHSTFQKIGEFAYPFSREALFFNNYIPTCGFLFKRELALEIGGFDEQFNVLEDWDFNFRLALKTDFVFVPYTVALYRSFGRGFVLESDYYSETEWRKLFYAKHLSKLDSSFLTKGYYNFIDINKAENKYLKSRLKELENKNIELQSNYNNLLKQKIKLEKTLNDILNSASWRYTHFLRLIKHFLRKNKHLSLKFIEEIKTSGYKNAFKKIYIFLFKNKNNYPIPKKLSFQERNKVLNELKYRPLISIIVPVYNTPPNFLRKCIKSVQKQYYPHWELCIVDGNSTNEKVREILKKFANKDKRIKIKFLAQNKGISGNSNEALKMAQGEFIGLLDHDDELDPNALLEVVKLLNKKSYLNFIYTDEDKISVFGRRCEPHFKPDWSPDLMRSYNYIGHFSVIRKKIIDLIGGFCSKYDGSQDYDLFLRIIEKTQKIGHIPKVLYHWRMHKSSFAQNLNAKSGAYEAAKKAISTHLERMGLSGKVLEGSFLGSYRVKYDIIDNPQIDIIIPSKDNVEILKLCIDSILSKSTYKNYKIFIVDNQSKEQKTFEYYNEISTDSRICIIKYDKKFNWSKLNNFAVKHTSAEYILFLNNDIEVITPEWLENMLEFIQRSDVGAVGSLLYYPNDTVQHGGVIIGLGGIAGHAHAGVPREDKGYFGRLKVIQNFSAVTGACMLTKRKVFEELGGFDENLPYDFNDIDFCLKLREKEYLIVYTPFAELYHHESLTRGKALNKERLKLLNKASLYMQQKWKVTFNFYDPYYNPNFSLQHCFIPK